MKSKKIYFGILMLGLIILLSNACRKDNDNDNDTGSASDNALAENLFTDVHGVIDQAASSNSMKGTDSIAYPLLGSCAQISIDTTVNPHTMTVDFGSTNCLCGDGRYRRGIIQVNYTGKYRDSGTVINVTFNNYYVNDNKIMGSKTITNLGRNSNNNLNWSVLVSGSVLKANGNLISWNSTRNREWIAGESTLTVWDDAYFISGSANGISANGNTFSVTITNPLKKEIGCKHFVSGTFDLNISGKSTRTVDFGNGVCDYTATVTINGNVYTLNLN